VWTDFEKSAYGRNQGRGRTVVFEDGVSALDIRQGNLGDCYLLSAMSVIAHTQPKLIEKLFHPKSKQYNEQGLYVLMLYKNRKPFTISLDDNFACLQNQHAFCRVSSKENTKEIWPILIEKAYSKLYGSYPAIEGGLVDTAFADLTNGAPDRYELQEPDVRRMLSNGQFWEKLKFWYSKNYLMGAGSPNGSDRDVSPMGIVQGHAYGILDVFELEGNQLVQLRNPWGDRTEWKGAWGDSSSQWTERRKRIVYERMKERGVECSVIGENDGIFWMSLGDFFSNFEQVFLCRFFDEEWKETSIELEWSTSKNTAGGCANNPTVGNNP